MNFMASNGAYAAPLEIVTEQIMVPNSAGLRIATCLDRPAKGGQGWVIIAPKFGETKKTNLPLAYTLAANGRNVVRFDHTRHVGESEGEKHRFTLSLGVADLLTLVDYLKTEYQTTEVTVVANSLSARAAIRAACAENAIAHLICIVGVVNVGATLLRVYQEDLVENYRRGRRYGVGDMLGIEMDYDLFLSDLIEQRLDDLTGCMADVAKCRGRLSFLAGENDVWVSAEEVAAAARQQRGAELIMLASAKHEVRENAKAGEALLSEVVKRCCDIAPLRPTPWALITRQNRVERASLRAAFQPTETENAFWADYLQRYKTLQGVEDYRGYLRRVGELLGPVLPGEVILDAGCGNGMVGMWVMRELMREVHAPNILPPVYIGLDLVPGALHEAMREHALHVRRCVAKARHLPPGAGYSQVNLDDWSLPADEQIDLLQFADDTFDKICCSLVLSYLQQPDLVLREFRRILKPGGRLVISSMKPHCDTSVIYRDFLTQSLTSNELTAGRDLMRAAGRIKLKEEQGLYTFFSADELGEMMESIGLSVTEKTHSFGEQAALVSAVK